MPVLGRLGEDPVRHKAAHRIGQARLLPSTAVDQLAATLASWMGVSDNKLALVAPNNGTYSLKQPALML